MKKMLMVVFMIGVLSCTSVSAEVETMENGNIRIYGNAGTETFIGIEVYKSPNSRLNLENLNQNEYLGIIKYYDQTTSKSDGSYEFFVDLAGESGEYTIYAGTTDVDFAPESFSYVTATDFENIAPRANNANISELKDILKNEYYKLGFTSEDLKLVSQDGLANVLFSTLKKYPLEATDTKNSKTIVEQALFISQLNENSLESIYDKSEEINRLAEGKLKDWYKREELTDEFKRLLTYRLSGKGFNTIDDYRAILTENFILSLIKEPNGVGNVKEIVTDFADIIGVDVTRISNTAWSNISGKEYNNFTALKSALTVSVQTGGGGSGGGGNSGGGRAPFSSVEISTDIVNTDKNKPINPLIFSDIENIEWAKDAIVSLAEKQIINGMGDGTFRPNDFVTREQLCKIIVKAFDIKDTSSENIFLDVEEQEWYAQYVKNAYAAGIIQGIGNRRFGIGNNVTRQDMCVMIYRAAGILIENKENLFSDDEKIAEYAKEAVYALTEYGAISGVGQSVFEPQTEATRAQVAKIIQYILEKR